MNDISGPLPDELHLQEADETAIKEANRLPDEPPVEKQEDAEPPKDEAAEAEKNEPEPKPGEELEGEGEEDGDDEDDPKLSKSQQRRLRQKEYQERLRTENAELKRRLGDLETKVNSPTQQEDAEPKLDDYDSFEEYTEAKIDWRVAKEIAKVQQTSKAEAAQAAQIQSNEQREAALMEKGRDKHEDFDATASVAEAYMTPTVASVLLASEHGHELLYALGQDTEQAAKIASLPPAAAALELGKMEANLTRPVPKKTTKAPEPLKTPTASSGSAEKDPSEMTMAEYKAWRAKQAK